MTPSKIGDMDCQALDVLDFCYWGQSTDPNIQQFVLFLWALCSRSCILAIYPLKDIQHKGWSMGTLTRVYHMLKAHMPHTFAKAMTQQCYCTHCTGAPLSYVTLMSLSGEKPVLSVLV